MKKILIAIAVSFLLFGSCAKPDPGIYDPCTSTSTNSGSSSGNGSSSGSSGSSSGCGSYNGHTLHKGSRGGCYYINSNGNKTYVDRSYCNC